MRVPSLRDLARQLGLGPSALRERCVAATGLNPSELLTEARLERACARLRAGAGNAEAAEAAGFATAQHLGAVFRRLLGTTPGRYRDAQRAQKSEAHDLRPDGGLEMSRLPLNGRALALVPRSCLPNSSCSPWSWQRNQFLPAPHQGPLF